ncbi:MAG: choice-of-anchor tandem repeat GloVer-containing protein [Candidatus Cybelea sp.]
MKTPGLSFCTLLVGCVAFAACTNATPPQEMPIVSSATHVTGSGQRSYGLLRHASATETVLYRFNGSHQPDGGMPIAGLTYVNGKMYGVTSVGSPFKAVLYSITPLGKYTILHKFTFAQAYELDGGLTAVGHNPAELFGTGSGNRTSISGTVFESTLRGRISVLHRFLNSRGDGAFPRSSLLNVNGTLYGTTSGGGTIGVGTVFSITPSGSEKVIYNFAGGNDGAVPNASLVELNGTLYGTTLYGGGCAHCGTVFSITAGGKESVLHRFLGGSNDGAQPAAPLVNVNGALYGTTLVGGGSGCQFNGNSGCGTVFRITRSGRESVLYKFGGSPNDGTLPRAGLLYVRGTMYGTTSNGGTGCDGSTYAVTGCGTVFRITPSGAETVLYRFANAPDGAHPQAGVIDVNGTLYGTAMSGGANGSGTIYSITL